MNKDNARDYLPLVQALAEGKTIQYKLDSGEWADVPQPIFNEEVCNYRIKPDQLENKLAIAEHLEQIALKMRSGDASAHNLSESIYQREGSFISEMKVTYECKTSKPEPKNSWYRVALFKDGTTDTADNLSHEVILKDHKRFVRWLTDRIEYTLPEGDV